MRSGLNKVKGGNDRGKWELCKKGSRICGLNLYNWLPLDFVLTIIESETKIMDFARIYKASYKITNYNGLI